MYDSISDVTTLDLAITSVCNAQCMDCARWWIDDQGQHYHNPLDTHRNHHWPIDQLQSHLTELTHIRRILMAGNAGDPMTHPHCVDLCEWASVKWPGVSIEIDTNASCGTDQQWHRLAQVPGVYVTFAVDGWQSGNAVYRRGVSWSRVEHIITQWCRWGGDGRVKTLDFAFNHQDRVKLAEWCDHMGIDWQLHPRWQNFSDQQIHQQQHNTQPLTWSRPTWPDHPQSVAQGKAMVKTWRDQGGHIQPECRDSGDWLYINHDHRVWPCCYWATLPYSQGHEIRAVMQDVLGADATWNSLDHHSLTHIIGDARLTNLDLTWRDTAQQPVCAACVWACGKTH